MIMSNAFISVTAMLLVLTPIDSRKSMDFFKPEVNIKNTNSIGYKTFLGAWFEIKYPSTFTAKGSLKSSSADGYDSAIFESPDHSVTFYIFSPQWRGNPTDIALKSGEKLLSTRTQKTSNEELKWWTIGANDGSYSRSYQEKTEKASNAHFIVGLKYTNSASLSRYKAEYAIFKNSLKQFAD